MTPRALCAGRKMEADVPTLDEMLRGGGEQSGGGPTGVNPELEQMLGRMAQMSGPMGGPGGGMPPVGGRPGAGMPMPPGGVGPSQAMPQQQGGAAAQPMAPEQANATYQMLIKAGLPPEIAKQAIAEPKFLQEVLLELRKMQQSAPPLGAPPQQGQATMPGGPQRPMA